MTPAIAPPTTDFTRPPADAPAGPDATADQLVYVYDPTDRTRWGEVRPVGQDTADGLATALRSGRSVAFVNLAAEFGLYHAAEFLNLPVSAVEQDIAAGRLPAVGPNRLRLRFADLVAYRDAMRADRRRALDELVEVERELGLRD